MWKINKTMVMATAFVGWATLSASLLGCADGKRGGEVVGGRVGVQSDGINDETRIVAPTYEPLSDIILTEQYLP